MTRATNARLAGFTFLFYIVVGIAGLIAFDIATRGSSIAMRLASISAHVPAMRMSFLASMLTVLCALILAVTLYALTRDEDVDLARLAMSCRIAEGVINTFPAMALLALLRIASSNGNIAPTDVTTASNFADLLLHVPAWSTGIGGTMFAVGSAIYSALFLRGRLIPTWLARLGVFASVILIVTVPAGAIGLMKISIANLTWLPMLAFEVSLGCWLIFTGAAKQPK